MKARLCFLLFLGAPAWAVVPLGPSAESWQLQELVNTSAQQLKVARQILSDSDRTAQSLDKASQILERLSSGLERSIQSYQGTKVYEKALLQAQADPDFVNRGSDGPRDPPESPAAARFLKFQNDSVSANLSAVEDQEKIGKALQNAEQGFIPKLQTQAQLGTWQTDTRVSAQLTQLLAVLHGLRGDARAESGGLGSLLQGSELQNRRQREATVGGQR